MAVLNLPGSLVVSDIFLMDHGSLLGYWNKTAYRSSYIFSPWYLTIIFYTILGLLLFYLTVRQVRRIET
jgi:hypothetical protein